MLLFIFAIVIIFDQGITAIPVNDFNQLNGTVKEMIENYRTEFVYDHTSQKSQFKAPLCSGPSVTAIKFPIDSNYDEFIDLRIGNISNTDREMTLNDGRMINNPIFMNAEGQNDKCVLSGLVEVRFPGPNDLETSGILKIDLLLLNQSNFTGTELWLKHSSEHFTGSSVQITNRQLSLFGNNLEGFETHAFDSSGTILSTPLKLAGSHVSLIIQRNMFEVISDEGTNLCLSSPFLFEFDDWYQNIIMISFNNHHDSDNPIEGICGIGLTWVD